MGEMVINPGAIDALNDKIANLTTVQTQSIPCPNVSYDTTTNLITVNLAKVGNVCTLTVLTGRTKSLSGNTTIATLPEGYRPTSQINVWEVTTETRYSIATDGTFSTVSAQDSNKMVRLYATYVTA